MSDVLNLNSRESQSASMHARRRQLVDELRVSRGTRQVRGGPHPPPWVSMDKFDLDGAHPRSPDKRVRDERVGKEYSILRECSDFSTRGDSHKMEVVGLIVGRPPERSATSGRQSNRESVGRSLPGHGSQHRML